MNVQWNWSSHKHIILFTGCTSADFKNSINNERLRWRYQKLISYINRVRTMGFFDSRRQQCQRFRCVVPGDAAELFRTFVQQPATGLFITASPSPDVCSQILQMDNEWKMWTQENAFVVFVAYYRFPFVLVFCMCSHFSRMETGLATVAIPTQSPEVIIPPFPQH